MFEYEIVQQKQKTLIIYKGRVDGITAPEMEKSLQSLFQDGNRQLLVDLSEIKYISSLGLRVLLKMQKEIKKAEGEIFIESMSEQVKTVFDMSGFDKLFRKYNTSFDSDKDSKQELQKSEISGIKIIEKELDSTEATITFFGDSHKLKSASFTQSDVHRIDSSEICFGCGLAALGNSYQEFSPYFGEAMVINHNMIVYPAINQSAVDVQEYHTEKSTQSYPFFYGFKIAGKINKLIYLQKDDGLTLQELKEIIFARCNSTKVGIVFYGKSNGIMGLNLKKIPVSENNPQKKDILSEQEFLKWFSYPIEPESKNKIILGTGIIGKATKASEKEILTQHEMHIHAAITGERILNQNLLSFESELERLVLKSNLSKIQHLLPESRFTDIALGIIKLQDQER